MLILVDAFIIEKIMYLLNMLGKVYLARWRLSSGVKIFVQKCLCFLCSKASNSETTFVHSTCLISGH